MDQTLPTRKIYVVSERIYNEHSHTVGAAFTPKEAQILMLQRFHSNWEGTPQDLYTREGDMEELNEVTTLPRVIDWKDSDAGIGYLIEEVNLVGTPQ